MTKTTLANQSDQAEALATWFVVDASKCVLGRMSSRIAEVLMGKHRPIYTPHVRVGAGVIVINAARAVVTGNKREGKRYRHYTGYPGGLRERPLGDHLERGSERLVKNVVRRMQPKNRLARQMLARLKVYAGAEHPHAAQRPQPLEVT